MADADIVAPRKSKIFPGLQNDGLRKRGADRSHRVVAGPVVHYDDLPVGILIRPERCQTLEGIIPAIPDDDYNGNTWTSAHLLGNPAFHWLPGAPMSQLELKDSGVQGCAKERVSTRGDCAGKHMRLRPGHSRSDLQTKPFERGFSCNRDKICARGFDSCPLLRDNSRSRNENSDVYPAI